MTVRLATQRPYSGADLLFSYSGTMYGVYKGFLNEISSKIRDILKALSESSSPG